MQHTTAARTRLIISCRQIKLSHSLLAGTYRYFGIRKLFLKVCNKKIINPTVKMFR